MSEISIAKMKLIIFSSKFSYVYIYISVHTKEGADNDHKQIKCIYNNTNYSASLRFNYQQG